MAVICSFYWSGFPFDNLCESAEYDAAYEGTFTVSSLGDVSETKLVTVAMHDPQYRFCNQDLMSSGNGIKFPFVASQQPVGNEWMTHDQEVVSTVFGWSALVIAAVIALKFIWGWIELLQTFFSSDYSVRLFYISNQLDCLSIQFSNSVRRSEMTKIFLSVR